MIIFLDNRNENHLFIVLGDNGLKYLLKMNSKRIWDAPELILQFLKDLLLKQRWVGDHGDQSRIITKRDQFNLLELPDSKIIGFLIDFSASGEGQITTTYFIPIELAYKTNQEEQFPILFNCDDTTIYLRFAEEDNRFFESIFTNITRNSQIQTDNSNTIFFHRFNFQSPPDVKLLSKRPLGGGGTTNTLVVSKWSDGTKKVFKIFRMVSRNPEIQMLQKLYAAGFQHIPRPLGCVRLNSISDSRPLILVTEYLDTTENGGAFFWNDLQMKLSQWQISADISTHLLRNRCEKLGAIIADFHFYSSNIKDSFFAPEEITEKDILSWKNKISRLGLDTFTNLKNQSSLHNIDPALFSIVENHMEPFLQHETWNLLERLVKIKVHQDLHLDQILSKESSKGISYILLDFEGDPLLSIEEKFQKDPVFRDLAAIYTAYHYITFNGLKEWFSTQKGITITEFIKIYASSINSDLSSSLSYTPEDLHRVRFAKAWEFFCYNTFLKSYIIQLKQRNVRHPLIPESLNLTTRLNSLFLLERFIKELHYETTFRKVNVSIPFLGLFELLGAKNDFFP